MAFYDRSVLIGRESECARIDRMLEEARGGRSGALVIRGDAGIGKSTLLEYAVAQAGAAEIVRALGVETESEFAYSGLHELLRPLLHLLPALPAVQADALRGALALAEAQGAGRLYIGAATLSLLAAAKKEGPVLCVIDDVHWLDEASAGALAFAARRLEAEGVIMLFAARGQGFRTQGIPELELTGLDAHAAVALLDNANVCVSPALAEELVAATGGNPLALLDLPRRLSGEQLQGTEPLPHPVPLEETLESVFAAQARSLSEPARRALVLAATADTRAMRVITRTGGASVAAFEECEDAGLLAIEHGQVTFTHPLVRSAVYQQATSTERRAAHRALADGFAEEERYAERRAWHAAAATVEPDEEVAARLESAAAAAVERRGHVAAAAMFERAARLTPGQENRARRLYLAADAARLAGQGDRALALADDAEAGADGLLRADLALLRARIELRRAREPAAIDRLVAEADEVEPLDAGRAGAMLAIAAGAATTEARVQLARRAVSLTAGHDGAPEVLATLALARALHETGEPAEAHEPLAHARTKLAANRALRHDPELILAAVETLAHLGSGEDDLFRELLDELTSAARSHAVVVLPRALLQTAWLDFEAGRWTEATLDFFEAARLADELGQSRERAEALSGNALIDALRGRTTSEHSGDGAAMAHILGLAALGAGDIDAAIAHLQTAAGDAAVKLRGLPAPHLDLLEAYLRAGRREEAEATADDLGGADAAWGRALLEGGAAFGEAGERFAERPFLLARIRLGAGEQLRREGSRREAREELRAALALFEQLDAEPWSERVRRELRASGETARRRQVSTLDELTPQELQIARLVAGGASQKEAAATLYLSPKTIEYHLGKVYRKLGISSGRQLQHRLAEQELLEAS
ncbi:MAG TPA: AAA family ATPase [Gaiellaceae bacterium]|nr:AAA family ATPase [Gaiellaceae bacterium]